MATSEANKEIERIREFSAQNDGSGMHEHHCIRDLLRELDQRSLRLAELKLALDAIAGMSDFAPSNLLRAPYEMQQIAIKALGNASRSSGHDYSAHGFDGTGENCSACKSDKSAAALPRIDKDLPRALSLLCEAATYMDGCKTCDPATWTDYDQSLRDRISSFVTGLLPPALPFDG